MSTKKRNGTTQAQNSVALQRSVLPLPLGLAQRSAKCRLCGEYFGGDGMLPRGWAYEFREMVFPTHVILNFGKECAHAKCLERHND